MKGVRGGQAAGSGQWAAGRVGTKGKGSHGDGGATMDPTLTLSPGQAKPQSEHPLAPCLVLESKTRGYFPPC